MDSENVVQKDGVIPCTKDVIVETGGVPQPPPTGTETLPPVTEIDEDEKKATHYTRKNASN